MLLVFIIYMLSGIACSPIDYSGISKKGGVQAPLVAEAGKLLSAADLFLNFKCIAKYYCNPLLSSNKCNHTESQLDAKMKKDFSWQHVMPNIAIVEADTSNITIYFKWSKSYLKKNVISLLPPFQKGQAWEISLVAVNKNFAKPYPDGTDLYPYKEGESSTNMPCGYRDVQNYTTKMSDKAYKKALKDFCGVSDFMYSIQGLSKINSGVGSLTNESQAQFAIGTQCPEKLVADKWYYVTYYLKPGTKPSSSYAYIYSSLIEDTFPLRKMYTLSEMIRYTSTPEMAKEIVDCPYTNGTIDMKGKLGTYICGRGGKRKLWINRLCIPTAKYVFIPGVDIKPNKAFCRDRSENKYENGDADGWFDHNKKQTKSMLMHGTKIGDCNPFVSGRGSSCNWFSIGMIGLGRSCWWNGVNCFFDRGKTLRYHPENFLLTFLNKSANVKSQTNLGSYNYIGFASSWVLKKINGFIQYLHNGQNGSGALMAPFSRCSGSCVYYVGGLIWKAYLLVPTPYKTLGFAIGDRYLKSGRYFQSFEHGYISYDIHDKKKCLSIFVNGHYTRIRCLVMPPVSDLHIAGTRSKSPYLPSKQSHADAGSSTGSNKSVPDKRSSVPEPPPEPRSPPVQKEDYIQPYCVRGAPVCICPVNVELECWAKKWGKWSKRAKRWIIGADVCIPVNIITGAQTCPSKPPMCRCGKDSSKWIDLTSVYGKSASSMKCSAQVTSTTKNKGFISTCSSEQSHADAGSSTGPSTSVPDKRSSVPEPPPEPRSPPVQKEDYIQPYCVRGAPVCICPVNVELECWAKKWGKWSKRAKRWIIGADICVPIHTITGAQTCPNKPPMCRCGKDSSKWIDLTSVYGKSASSMKCSPQVTSTTKNKGFASLCR